MPGLHSKCPGGGVALAYARAQPFFYPCLSPRRNPTASPPVTQGTPHPTPLNIAPARARAYGVCHVLLYWKQPLPVAFDVIKYSIPHILPAGLMQGIQPRPPNIKQKPKTKPPPPLLMTRVKGGMRGISPPRWVTGG